MKRVCGLPPAFFTSRRVWDWLQLAACSRHTDPRISSPSHRRGARATQQRRGNSPHPIPIAHPHTNVDDLGHGRHAPEGAPRPGQVRVDRVRGDGVRPRAARGELSIRPVVTSRRAETPSDLFSLTLFFGLALTPPYQRCGSLSRPVDGPPLGVEGAVPKAPEAHRRGGEGGLAEACAGPTPRGRRTRRVRGVPAPVDGRVLHRVRPAGEAQAGG